MIDILYMREEVATIEKLSSIQIENLWSKLYICSVNGHQIGAFFLWKPSLAKIKEQIIFSVYD